jgi:glycosyltransferase involved in cell wall biosynthesis
MTEDLIVISHLRWDFVWQRPQHLLSRIAKHRRVLFVEEPMTTLEASEPFIEAREVAPNVTTIRMFQPADHHHWIGHGDPTTALTYTRLFNHYLTKHVVRNPALWLYTPMGMEFADNIRHQLLIYDVMDELSTFKGASHLLREREAAILREADIVFTGGASLYEAKCQFNENTYLFPSGVEIEHFAQAASPQLLELPADIASIPHPTLGYYGVIDERMDLNLIAHMASAHPEWYMVLIGPVVKIDAADLPQAPNIYYLGMKTYQELPSYLARFDVALIPFAVNEATRFLSPTKTLEYMAAHKPIVSTPIHDVEVIYGSIVKIGHTCEEFVAHVEAALREDHGEKRMVEDAILAKHTWDSIADQMEQIIEGQLVAIR